MNRAIPLGLLVLLTARVAAGQGQEKVVDLRAKGTIAADSFETLWTVYRRSDRSGDRETAEKALTEIRRLRIERNIRSFEPLGLALVGAGLERLAGGERDQAEEDFRRAISLDPFLPDAQFGLALADLKQGPLGWLPAGSRGPTRELFGVQWSFLTLEGWKHLALPALNLSLFKFAMMIRLSRAGTREMMLTDTVKFARAAGLSEWTILRRHVLKLISIPIVTVFGLANIYDKALNRVKQR